MAKDSDDKSKTEKAEEEPKNPLANWFWVILLTVYMAALGIILFWALVAFFPATIVNDPAAPTYSKVGFMLWTLTISSEMRLILLVIIAGALGSLVHGFRSLFWYVGKRAFEKSWVLMYFLLPFVGSALSLIFYFVLRGGLFSPNATVDATSPFGFIGVAGLVGMFSNKAASKLKEIADSIFSTKGEDNIDPNEDKSKSDVDKEAKDKKG
jgi:magnesium-transporting ATPase (P-type)